MFLNSPIACVRIFSSVWSAVFFWFMVFCWGGWGRIFQQLFGFVLIFLFLGISWVFFTGLIHGLSFLSEEWGAASRVDGGDGDRQRGCGVFCLSAFVPNLDSAPSCSLQASLHFFHLGALSLRGSSCPELGSDSDVRVVGGHWTQDFPALGVVWPVPLGRSPCASTPTSLEFPPLHPHWLAAAAGAPSEIGVYFSTQRWHEVRGVLCP